MEKTAVTGQFKNIDSILILIQDDDNELSTRLMLPQSHNTKTQHSSPLFLYISDHY